MRLAQLQRGFSRALTTSPQAMAKQQGKGKGGDKKKEEEGELLLAALCPARLAHQAGGRLQFEPCHWHLAGWRQGYYSQPGRLAALAVLTRRRAPAPAPAGPYSATVRLPVTNFNLRANSVVREPEIQKWCAAGAGAGGGRWWLWWLVVALAGGGAGGG